MYFGNIYLVLQLVVATLTYYNDGIYFINKMNIRWDRCWFMNSSGHHFGDIITKELQPAYTPIISINDQIIRTELKEKCDGLIYVNDNKLGMLKSVMKNLERNATHLRNSKLILIYFGDEDFVLEDHVVKEMHNKALNVLIFQIHRAKSAMIMDNDHLGLSEMSEMRITAPFINKTIILSNKNDTSNMEWMIEDLFKFQKWRPNFSPVLNKTFRISLINSMVCIPAMIRKDDYKDGIEYRIINEVSKDWKIKFHVVVLPSPSIGPWRQVKIDLKNRLTDLGTCSFLMSIKDDNNDGCYPHTKVCQTFFVPKPLPVNPSQYLYLPLSSKVWITFVASSVAVAMSMYFLAVIGINTNDSQWINSPFHSLSTCIWNTFTILTSQGITVRPNQNSLRIFFMAWVLVCLLVSVGYGTGYTSLLTYPRYTKDINTIEDMVGEDNIYWGEDIGTYSAIQDAFSKDNNTFIKELLTRFKLENDTNDRLHRIQNRDYSIFVTSYGNTYATKIGELRNSSIKFKVIKECLLEPYQHFPLQKDSPYTEIFNDKIHRLVEAGIIDFWLTDVLLKNNLSYMRELFSTALEEYDLRPLIVNDLQGAFFLLLVGLLLSSFVLLWEIAPNLSVTTF